MNKNKGLKVLIVVVLSFLLIESINTFDFSHADAGWDTSYPSGGFTGGGYASGGDFDLDVGSGSGGGLLSTVAIVVLGIIVIVSSIVRAIEKHEIKKEIQRQQLEQSKLEGISDEQIKEIDEDFDLSILTAIAKSAYEKYAKNIGNPRRLQSIFTNEYKEKFDFDINSKRKIENIEFVDIKIIDFSKEKNVEFVAYYIVKCNDYFEEKNKDKIIYNKIIFTITNEDDLWLIKNIED